MRVFNKTVVSGVVLNANYTSTYTPLRNIVLYSISAIITGTPAGSIKLQASNDPETNDTQYNSGNKPPSTAPTNWVDIANSSFSLSSAGETMWNVSAAGYNFVRIVYTDTSGGTSTAVMKIIFNGKGA